MKTFTLEPTSNKDLKRVVDRNGDWSFYKFLPTNQYLYSVNHILDLGYPKAPRLIEWMKKVSKEESDRKLKEGGERGDRIHQAIRILLSQGKIDRTTKVLAEDNKTLTNLTNDDWDALLAFQTFWERHGCVLHEMESAVKQVVVGYAGTLDAIVTMTKSCEVKSCKCNGFIGCRGLFDWKSSAGIYDSYGPQVAAYAHCVEVEPDYSAILRIGTYHKTTGGYEVEFYSKEETEIHHNEFRSALELAKPNLVPFKESEIYDIPDAITLTKREIKTKKPRKPRAKKVATKSKSKHT